MSTHKVHVQSSPDAVPVALSLDFTAIASDGLVHGCQHYVVYRYSTAITIQLNTNTPSLCIAYSLLSSGGYHVVLGTCPSTA